jgi:TonB family protein
MKRSAASRGELIVVVMLLFLVTARAQNVNQKNRQEKCAGPVYTYQQVTRRARITQPLDIKITEDARAHDVHGRIVVEAVLCRTGRVTDLRATESLPYGMTESALEAVRRITFTPAEMNWHTVSQRQRFEFLINDRGIREIAPGDAAGRLVESVEVIGNRRLSKEEILRWVRTRPGERYRPNQLTEDLNAVLATGYFDKLRTRVNVEDGIRGGVVVTFEVFELPLIGEVKFEGLKELTESVILDALLKENIDVRKGAVYDPVKVRSAVRVIRNLLESKGQGNANVEVLNQNVTATAIVLTFVIR